MKILNYQKLMSQRDRATRRVVGIFIKLLKIMRNYTV